ncbi:MAG: acyltransferase [Burkholderiales bacterium]|nr:acyltransferase [Burkholderiales bacterium]
MMHTEDLALSRSLIRFPGRSLVFANRVIRKIRMWILRPLFGAYGKKFWFDPAGFYSYRNIYVGDDVFLGLRPRLQCALARIVIGNKVMFGPEVCILAGNHNVSLVGRFMCDVTNAEKRPQDDLGVVIEDDVWVCARATILDGVTIGRGAIVAAGAVVSKSVPPYALVAGVPARVIAFRWDAETLLRHEAALYPEVERLTSEQLSSGLRVGQEKHV